MAQHTIFCETIFDKPAHGRSQHGDHKETTYTSLLQANNAEYRCYGNQGDQLDQLRASRDSLQVPFNP